MLQIYDEQDYLVGPLMVFSLGCFLLHFYQYDSDSEQIWSNGQMQRKVRCGLGLVLQPFAAPAVPGIPCSTFSQPFYLQLTLSAYQQPMPSFRLNGGCYGNFGRHKSPAARRSEESRKSTLFVSTRAHGERTAVVTRGRRRSGRVANVGQVSSARATCKAACAKNLMLALISQRRHNCTVLLLFL